MRKLSYFSLFILLLLTSSKAYAIPPPDTWLTVWQSMLQLLGIGAAFIASIWFMLKQNLLHYYNTWQHKRIWAIGIIGLLGLLLLFWASMSFAATRSAALPNVENISINAVLDREPSWSVRRWKKQTLKEMQQEVNDKRKQRRLATMNFTTMPSLTPQALATLKQTQADQIFLLDTREAYERQQFNIGYQTAVRYADLVLNAVPRNLPKEKLIIVLCHSGLRGYIATHFLKQAGYQNVAFLQGGLGAWSSAKLPINGNEAYATKPPPFPILTKQQVSSSAATILQVDSSGSRIRRFNKINALPIELTPSKEIEQHLNRLGTQAIIVACNTYAGCFHAINFAQTIKDKRKNLLGIYDDTQKYLASP